MRPHTPSRSPHRFTPPASPLRHTFSESLMDENLDNAQSIISGWDQPQTSHLYPKLPSLFRDNRHEAKQLLKSVKDLQAAMHFFVKQDSTSDKLVRAQALMQRAMSRLEKEFFEILSTNRQYLEPESVSSLSSRASACPSTSDCDDEWEDGLSFATESTARSETSAAASSMAMSDLKVIANCMISSGYGKECVKIYKIVRRSTVEEALYRLGVDRTLTCGQIQKMDWGILEAKIKSWLRSAKFAVSTIFYGERVLCDHVFSSSVAIRESCFDEITRDCAMGLFGFAESVAKYKKLSPEKMFRMLDMYEVIANQWPEIESTFSFDSASAVRLQAVNSLAKLADAVRLMLVDFEAAIQKDASKSPLPGGGVHPLTRYVMNYLTFLADYSEILFDIVADWPSADHHHLHFHHDDQAEEENASLSLLSTRLSWLVLLVLCKLDTKAKLYKDVAHSYLFLADNLQYVVAKVRRSNLKYLLGDKWLAEHESKVKQYLANYERIGWSKVFASLPEDPEAEIDSVDHVKDMLRRFNEAFEEAYRKQATWVVADSKLREEVKLSLTKKLLSRYHKFYKTHAVPLRRDTFREGIVRFSPQDLANYLSDLLHAPGGSGGSVSSSSHSSSSSSSSPASLGIIKWAF